MAIPTIKRFSPSCLPRVAYFVGSLHILGSLWNILGAACLLNYSDPEDNAFAETYNTETGITIIVVATLFGLVGFLLILGTYKKSHLMFLPWLILEGISLVLYFVFTLVNLISMIIPYRHSSLSSIALSMVYFSIIALCVYVWFAILQFYQTIRDEKQKPIQDDAERLVAGPIRTRIRKEKPYPPAYFIPILYSDSPKPPSLIKY